MYSEDEQVLFTDLAKYSNYNVFIRAVSRQFQTGAENPNEEIIGNFSSAFPIRTDQDGLLLISPHWFEMISQIITHLFLTRFSKRDQVIH